MKTPDQIYLDVENDPECDGLSRGMIAIECMKRFGFQCWMACLIDLGDGYEYPGQSEIEREYFDDYLKDLYLNEIAKQAQGDGEYK
jgi:hypothetical protein